MLKGFEHINLTTSDMDRTLAFYRDLLGMREVVRRASGKGGEIAFVAFPGGGMLEIVRPPAEVATPAREVPRTEAGIRHLALTVESVDEAVAKVSAAGVTITEQPRDAHNRDIMKRVAFCLDPDGIQVEFVER